VASTSIAAAAGAEHASGGLPQFDFSWWAGEAVWTVAIFVVLLILFTKVFVPRVGGTIDEREDRISGDIGAARRPS
jgi:F-type H+-transporting ATPase subunit b